MKAVFFFCLEGGLQKGKRQRMRVELKDHLRTGDDCVKDDFG